MKKEYREQLDRMRYFFENYKDISDDKLHEECMKNFVDLTPLVTASRDDEVLGELFTFFEKEFDYEFEGVCEDLKSEISANYNADQIFKTYCEKFEYLLKNNIYVCAELGSWCAFPEYFAKFRHTFNANQSKHSAEFLELLNRGCVEDFQKGFINLLREDMKKW